ncbi:MAG: PAS domain-containing protein [Clostridium sp.]|nr:PAS domain-containing protein [Clostridium sp.]MCM1398885.1 PAS domain-containing protein [Clostridium sp.]MCM1458743.1 PAS domain-containing protein [Bacteroides sp.]
MVLENLYLRKAIAKAGYVVIVKTCQKNDKTSKVDYISPNASMLGMNIEMINKGLKLVEDYIFPEDREQVARTVMNALRSNVESYVHEYRMVGDDGTLYNVSNEIVIVDENEETFKVEMYISLAKGKSNHAVEPRKSYDGTTASYEHILENDWFPMMMKSFSEFSMLYSAFVDMDGKVVFEPIGPATNLGDFYDLFEKPEYKEYYKFIVSTALDSDEPVIIDREEGGIGKICAAPIVVNGETRGLWILGSYTEEETNRLKEICEYHRTIAAIMSDYLYKNELASVEAAKSKGAGIKLREELAKQSIINDALSKVNSRLIDSVEQVVGELLRDVGINMDVEKMMLYTIAKTPKADLVLKNYWDVGGNVPGEEILRLLPQNKYIFAHQFEKNDGRYIVDSNNMTAEGKLNIMRYGFKAAMAQAVYMNDELYGMLVFAECKSDRAWTVEELRFAKSITLVIQNILENAYGDDNIRNVNNHLIETYNNFDVGIFVRDAYTGEVLFSNKKMDDMLGYDFKYGDSCELITDLRDRYDNISGMRKSFITKNKVTKWRSYIQKLDAIMDITEINMEWLSGQPASLIILREAGDS